MPRHLLVLVFRVFKNPNALVCEKKYVKSLTSALFCGIIIPLKFVKINKLPMKKGKKHVYQKTDCRLACRGALFCSCCL